MDNNQPKKKAVETADFDVDNLSALKACGVYFTAIILGFFFAFAPRDRDNYFVRFNAFQALFLLALSVAAAIVFGIFVTIFTVTGIWAAAVVFYVLMFLCLVFLFVVTIITSYLTYCGKRVMLPLLGKWAQAVVIGKQEKPAEKKVQTANQSKPAEKESKEQPADKKAQPKQNAKTEPAPKNRDKNQ